MTLFIRSLPLFLGLLWSGACSTLPPLSGDLAITNVDIIDLESEIITPDKMIIIEAGEIIAVTDHNPGRLAGVKTIIDGKGRLAMPGLWDSHTHMIADESQDFDAIAAAYLNAGVTHIRDMGATLSQLEAFNGWEESGSNPGLSVTTAGTRWLGQKLPYGDPDQFSLITTKDETQDALAHQVELGVDLAKIYGPMDLAHLNTLGQAARELGLPLSGHIPFGLSLVDLMSVSPMSLEHFGYNFDDCGDVDGEAAFRQGISARFRGNGGNPHRIFIDYLKAIDWKSCDPILKQLARAQIAWTPTLGVVAGYGDNRGIDIDALPEDDLCRTEDALYSEDPSFKTELQQELGKAVRALNEAGVELLAGSDAQTFCMGHGRGLIAELKLLSQYGLGPAGALRAATIIPAKLYGQQPYGGIQAGYPADFILLDRSPLDDLTALETVSATITPAGYRSRGNTL